MKVSLAIALLALLTCCDKQRQERSNHPQNRFKTNELSILYVSAFPDGKVELNGWSLPLDVAIDRINNLSGTQTQARYYYTTPQNQTPPIASKILSALIAAQFDIQLISKPHSPALTDNRVKAASRIIQPPWYLGCGPIAIPHSIPPRSKNLFSPPFFPPDSQQHYHITVNQRGRTYPIVVARYGKSWLGCVGESLQDPWYFEPITAQSPQDCLALLRHQHQLTGEFIKGKRPHR
ncbi:MAG: hypothetical protein L3J39_14040 [Verrucomicrobiales bacterium]|nr:hypothetical protein [Verrucomicrobiales bacterium]